MAIHKKQVQAAFQEYDELYPLNEYPPMGKTPWYKHKNYCWAIFDDKGKPYPLKYIYSLITNQEPKKFNTADAKSELKKLGFTIAELTQEMCSKL